MPPRARTGTARKKPTTTTRAFLFSDLRDYTSYVEAKGDAAAARLLREYRRLVRREVARHDGAEVKTEGDSFYVVFDSPSGALECAVAILRSAAVEGEKDPTTPLRIGMGLHAGETVEYDDQFVGSAVNIASRLAGKAGAMELLISDTLRGLVRTSQDLPMSDRGALELKGVAEPIRAWTVEWRERAPVVLPPAPAPAVIASAPASAPAAGQLLCPVVVGRAAETARFDAALAAAIGGAGQSVVLGGEAGVGKTKFVREAQEHASARGARVLIGLTHQSDGTLPYAPFVSAIRSGFHGLDREELGRVLQRSAPDLAELFPELGKMESAAVPTGVERHRLSVAFQHLFRAFARETPVLVVLEDLHWADETSLELLQHLAREMRDARVLLLATYRSDEMHRRHPFLRTLAELQRERLVTEIQLKRLTPDETKELIRSTMATRDPNVRVSDEFRDALYARSEGNPFFTEELLKALVDSGGVFMQDGGWARKPIDELEIPGSIREAVRARIEELTEEARRTLSVASVIGLRFGFDTLRTAAGVDETTLERHLREFIEAQLVIEAGDDDEEGYSFRHALTREVVYDDLLVRERKRVHRMVADAISEQRNVEPALVALHLLAAGENGRAAPKLREAAERAMRASAPREAAAHYERVLEIGVPDDELAELLEQLAEAYHGFDETLSLKTANEAAEAYRERGDRRGTSRMLRLASRNYWLKGDGEPAQRLAQEAIDQVADDESIELARALAHMAGLKMTAGMNEPAIAYADRAIALAERFDDTFALSNALISKGSVLARTNSAVGFEIIDRGRQIAMKSGLPITASRGWNNMSLWFRFIGRSTEEQLAFVREGIAWSQAHGVEAGSLSFIRNMHAGLLAETGRFDEAISEYDWIINSARNALGAAPKAWLLLAREGVAAVRDDVPYILRLAERAGEPQAWVPTTLICAFILYAAGRRSDADDVVSRLADRLRDDEGSRLSASGPWHALTLAVAILAGRDDLVDVVAADREAPAPQAAEARAQAVVFARAFRRDDLPAAGNEMRTYQERLKNVGTAIVADVTLIVASTFVAGQRLAAVPSWRGPLLGARAFAERAGAKWWLEVIPEPA